MPNSDEFIKMGVDKGLAFLEHHGIKGQKWGIRNKRPVSAKEQKARAKRQKASAKRRTLSDDEIKNYIERIQNEKKLKSLVEEDLSPGKAATKRILSESGQKVAKTVVTGAALFTIKSALDKKFSIKEAAGFIAPKPKNR